MALWWWCTTPLPALLPALLLLWSRMFRGEMGMGMGEDGGNVKSESGCCTRGVPVGSDGREGEDSGEDDAGVEMGDDGGRTSLSAALSLPRVAEREDGCYRTEFLRCEVLPKEQRQMLRERGEACPHPLAEDARGVWQEGGQMDGRARTRL